MRCYTLPLVPNESQAQNMSARVIFGWGAFKDFATVGEALSHSNELLTQPVSDPALATVTILDLTASGVRRPLATASRPISAGA